MRDVKPKLSAAFLGFAILQIGMALFTNMHGVFINTFLLKATGDFNVALSYNMVVFLAQACFMVLSVFLVRRRSNVTSIRVGLSLYALIYLAIIVFGESLAGSYVLVALFFAAAGGFTTLPYGVLLSEFTNDRNRDAAVGYLNLWLGMAALSMPAVAGALISLSGGFNGYRIMFAVALALNLGSLYLTTRIAPVAPLERKSKFKLVLTHLLRHKVERLMYVASALSSVREGVFRFILSLILYEYLKSEAVIGLNALICGLAAVLASWAYAKVVTPENRFLCMFLSVTVMLTGSVLMLFFSGTAAIVVFGILSSLANLFMVSPQDNYTYLFLQVLKRTQDKRPEYQAIKEFFLAVGRNVGILLTLIMMAAGWGPMVPLFAVVATQYLMIWVTKLAADELDRERGRERDDMVRV